MSGLNGESNGESLEASEVLALEAPVFCHLAAAPALRDIGRKPSDQPLHQKWQSSPFVLLAKIGQDIRAGPCLLACHALLAAYTASFLMQSSQRSPVCGRALSTALLDAQGFLRAEESAVAEQIQGCLCSSLFLWHVRGQVAQVWGSHTGITQIWPTHKFCSRLELT